MRGTCTTVNQPCDLAFKYSSHGSHFTLSLVDLEMCAGEGLEKEIEESAKEKRIRRGEKEKEKHHEQTTLYL